MSQDTLLQFREYTTLFFDPSVWELKDLLKVMPRRDYSEDTSPRTLVLLTKSLEQHEKEMDRLIEKLSRVSNSILSGYGSLNEKLELVREKADSVECDLNELRKSLTWRL